MNIRIKSKNSKTIEFWIRLWNKLKLHYIQTGYGDYYWVDLYFNKTKKIN